MTKQGRKLVNDSFKAVKQLITKCNLDPYYKGYLLMRINKVIKNKNSHFNAPTVHTNLASLFSWTDNTVNNKPASNFWSTVDIYLNDNDELYEKHLVSLIDETNSISK